MALTAGTHVPEQPPTGRYHAVALNALAVGGAMNASFSLVPSVALASQKMNS